MGKKKKQLLQDGMLLLISISVAIMLSKTGLIHSFILSLGKLKLLGVLLAGACFTSIFTTAPSIALLSELAKTTPLWMLATIGGIGAVCGDYILFLFVKDRIASDLTYLLSQAPWKRFFVIFKTRLFKFFIPFLGALIIASPLPDELGIAMIGLSKVRDKIFIPLSFAFNAIGIFIIGWIAKTVT